MIELYIKQQILRLYRLIRQLGPFVTVLILYLLFMLLVGVYNSPKYYSCGIYLLVIIIIQLLRKDVYFLKSVFGKRYRYIFLLENSMIAVPFEVLCVIRNFIDEFLLIFICAYVITLIPQKKINVHLPSHPLLPMYGYEFRRAFRISIIEYLLLFVIAVIGFVYNNIKISYVALEIYIYLYTSFLLIPYVEDYIYNYKSISAIVNQKCKVSLISSFLFSTPFVILILMDNFDISTILNCCSIYLSIFLLFTQVEVLRLGVKNNELIFSIFLLSFFSLSAVSIFYKYFIVVSFVLSIMCFMYLFNKIKNQIND